MRHHQHFLILCVFSLCLLVLGGMAGWGARGWSERGHAPVPRGAETVEPETRQGMPRG